MNACEMYDLKRISSNDSFVFRETVSKQIPKTFTTCERSTIVNSIMRYTKYGEHPFDVGLEQLIHKSVFSAAFPLHDGPYEWPENDNQPLNDRQVTNYILYR